MQKCTRLPIRTIGLWSNRQYLLRLYLLRSTHRARLTSGFGYEELSPDMGDHGQLQEGKRQLDEAPMRVSGESEENGNEGRDTNHAQHQGRSENRREQAGFLQRSDRFKSRAAQILYAAMVLPR